MDSGGAALKMSSRTSGNFTKKRQEDGSTTEECDSTTEPNTMKAQYHVGEDVYYQEDSGQNILGTVGQIQGKKFKLQFDDGSEKWAPYSRLKKVAFSLNGLQDDAQEKSKSVSESSTTAIAETVGSSKKKTKSDLLGHIAPKENYQVTCGSCGTQKMITPKKAHEYSPYTSTQYNCRKCINKSKTSKNNGVPIIAAHYLAAARGRPRGSETNGAMSSSKGQILEHGIANGVYRPESNICLHCRNQILEKVGLRCTMCERPCHPSCLALTPPPLPGDIFWSIICHVCGTQKHDDSPENDSQKLYSSRRSISCWSDVAYLLLSCLCCSNSNEKFFDLDEKIIPFWEENIARLHLPRQYKTAEPTDRRKYLLLALNNASLRFLKDDKKKWAIKDNAYRSFQMVKVVKPPAVSGGRAVTAAGFPISVRANNPEAASAAMTNIAQTIATQAAANKANGQSIPLPKNSPSHVSPKSSSGAKTSSTVGSGGTLGRKQTKSSEHPQVAKKTAHELNNGVQRKANEIWPQSRFGTTKFLPELPTTNPNNIVGAPVVEPASLSVPSSGANASGNATQQSQQPSYQKHNLILSPSSGGAARVTGVLINSSTEANNRVGNSGSYPVRKNGSPIFNKSIRVETVEKRKEAESSAVNRLSVDTYGIRKPEDLIRESPGFNNQSSLRFPVKRKNSPVKPTGHYSPTSSSKTAAQEIGPTAKKVKMSLPSSTDVTSKRLMSSQPKSTDSDPNGSPESPSNKQKKALSPLQKLSDLIRNGNGGLTIARLTHTESGVQTVAINPSTLEEAMVQDKSGLAIPLDKSGQFPSTPIKDSNGATNSNNKDDENKNSEENTKDKVINVTTSPRALKLASVASPGSSNTAPLIETRMTRPVRLKRAVVANAQAQKKSKELSENDTEKSSKKLSRKAAAAAVVKASRGRPKKPFRGNLQFRRPNGAIGGNFMGQFNGPVVDTNVDGFSKDTINESEYTWANSTINDLLQYGHGYRLECLPRPPEGKKDVEVVTQAAIKHLREELAPRPPSYWSSSLNLSHSKKPSNQRSRKDLKDLDSYYICGRRETEDGFQYQVVWRDGYGFEYSSDDEEELGSNFGDNYLYFEDYNYMEYFFDKTSVVSNVSLVNGNCDNNISASVESVGSDTSDGRPKEKIFLSTTDALDQTQDDVSTNVVKAEPEDSEAKDSSSSKKDRVIAGNGQLEGKSTLSNNCEPLFIDLTDSP